jgi:hypothetical chaperone protein
MKSSLTYAIDFGTSNSLLGAADQFGMRGFASIDPDSPDPTIMRSLLFFPNASSVFYGARALREFGASDHTGRFIRSIKRQLPSRHFIGTFVDNRPFNLEDLIGLFLGELRKRANTFFGEDVTRVVLGRPARFAPDDADDRYAEARLERAARIAGFTEIEFFAEPVAAALGYSKEDGRNQTQQELVLAADFGGGTSDFTLYQMGSREFRSSDVLSMGGVSLAGDALDSAIMRHRISPYFGTGVRYQVPFGSNILTMPPHLMERICHPGEISLLRKQDTFEFLKNVKQWSLGAEDRKKMDRLFILLQDQLGLPIFEKIEMAKRELSNESHARFQFNYPEIEIDENIKRKDFESYAKAPLDSIINSLDETLKKAAVAPEKIDRVLCTGGTAKVHWLRECLTHRFGADKMYNLDPFRGVAQGLMERAFEKAKM